MTRKHALALAMGITATLVGSVTPVQADGRVSNSTKGSLLIYSKVDLRWNAAGDLMQDTIIELTNDLEQDVYVQMYFVNGDEPRDAVYAGDPPQMIAEGEPGWNWVDLQVLLTANQPVYWSASTGLPLGAAPFDILDPSNGNGPGRPTADGGRMLRGFLYVWAVDASGITIRWNHLSGAATIINYDAQTAWEYNAWAFQSNVDEVSNGDFIGGTPGQLNLIGTMYDRAYDVLLMDFFASGSQALSSDTVVASIDTDLTLHPVSADLRQDTRGPITTKAKFDIWNENERRFSGTERCITCWDQTLLSNYDAPNHFLIQNLQTDKGKARIDGMASSVCDSGVEFNGIVAGDIFRYRKSEDASLLGVVAKVIAFSGVDSRQTRSGRSLVGMGIQSAEILQDVISPPGELRDEAYDRAGLLTPITGEDTRTFEGSKRLDRTSRPR